MLVASLLLAIPLAAHHSFTGTYDTDRRVSLEGVVTRIDWVNPHAYFFVDVADAQGTTFNWALEFGQIFELERDGWRGDTLAIGDVVQVVGYPARGPAHRAFATSVVLAGTDETVFAASGRVGLVTNRPAPRWPDGQVRLGPAPGERGYWGAGSVVGLFEEMEVPIPMNRDAILDDLADAARVAPFQPWARALYERRQRRLLVDDPMSRCVPPGGPRQFDSRYGFQFLEERELGRILVLLGGGDRNWRLIATDGRPLAQRDEVVRTYYGTSVGHWEGDTLVVESVGFNERFWFSRGGLPHTEQLHLRELFTRTDYATLGYEVTIDDPGAYTRPWTASWTIEWVPDEEIQEYFCEENAESTFLR